MPSLSAAVAEFLALRRIAVAGVSRDSRAAANVVYRKLRGAGYQVFPVNPQAEQVEGDACYPNLTAIPGGVEGVVIVTPPEAGARLVRECAALGVAKIWLHRSFGPGSVSAAAVEIGRQHNLTVIAGGCPLMFRKPVDPAHTCMRWILKLTGGLPKTV